MTARGALLEVARSPVAVTVGAVAAVAVFLFQVWLPNLGLIWSVVTSEVMSPSDKVGFLWDSLGAIRTNFSVLGAWLAGTVSLLFGLNAAVVLHDVRRRVSLGATAGAGAAGLVAAVLGVGCSACGAVVLSFLIGTTATASFVGLLPLRGQELNLLSVAVLAATFVVAVRKLTRPVVCAPSVSTGTRR